MYSGKYDVYDVTLSVYPHRNVFKCVTHVPTVARHILQACPVSQEIRSPPRRFAPLSKGGGGGGGAIFLGDSPPPGESPRNVAPQGDESPRNIAPL